ncbi:hypothetical protein K402DRAFT_452725 [Aulographum hederae CBS 113979]|uniref:Uncharacterized protein n=1 Tax=Aulographum hederae CBS 113979 TaxID=1176131 RepID=A0A6G1H5Y9_9PEZI|nr:hypothetical protein K402DRAFT_452725 [Aulographum hederae CBS 113979]
MDWVSFKVHGLKLVPGERLDDEYPKADEYREGDEPEDFVCSGSSTAENGTRLAAKTSTAASGTIVRRGSPADGNRSVVVVVVVHSASPPASPPGEPFWNIGSFQRQPMEGGRCCLPELMANLRPMSDGEPHDGQDMTCSLPVAPCRSSASSAALAATLSPHLRRLSCLQTPTPGHAVGLGAGWWPAAARRLDLDVPLRSILPRLPSSRLCDEMMDGGGGARLTRWTPLCRDKIIDAVTHLHSTAFFLPVLLQQSSADRLPSVKEGSKCLPPSLQNPNSQARSRSRRGRTFQGGSCASGPRQILPRGSAGQLLACNTALPQTAIPIRPQRSPEERVQLREAPLRGTRAYELTELPASPASSFVASRASGLLVQSLQYLKSQDPDSPSSGSPRISGERAVKAGVKRYHVRNPFLADIRDAVAIRSTLDACGQNSAHNACTTASGASLKDTIAPKDHLKGGDWTAAAVISSVRGKRVVRPELPLSASMSSSHSLMRSTTPITPHHSPHPSVHSNRSLTPGLLTLHEYRRQQNTPSPQSTKSEKRIRRRPAASGLNSLEHVPLPQATPSTRSASALDSPFDPTRLTRPKARRVISQSPSSQNPTINNPTFKSPTKLLTTSHSLNPLRIPRIHSRTPLLSLDVNYNLAQKADSCTSLRSKERLPVQDRLIFKPRKRLPRNPESQNLLAISRETLPLLSHRSSSFELLHSAPEPTTTTNASTISLSRFPQPPPSTSTPSQQPTHSHPVNIAAHPAATVVHYRGASFDLLNPHSSLSLSTLSTSTEPEIEPEDYFFQPSPESHHLTKSPLIPRIVSPIDRKINDAHRLGHDRSSTEQDGSPQQHARELSCSEDFAEVPLLRKSEEMGPPRLLYEDVQSALQGLNRTGRASVANTPAASQPTNTAEDMTLKDHFGDSPNLPMAPTPVMFSPHSPDYHRFSVVDEGEILEHYAPRGKPDAKPKPGLLQRFSKFLPGSKQSSSVDKKTAEHGTELSDLPGSSRSLRQNSLDSLASGHHYPELYTAVQNNTRGTLHQREDSYDAESHYSGDGGPRGSLYKNTPERPVPRGYREREIDYSNEVDLASYEYAFSRSPKVKREGDTLDQIVGGYQADSNNSLGIFDETGSNMSFGAQDLLAGRKRDGTPTAGHSSSTITIPKTPEIARLSQGRGRILHSSPGNAPDMPLPLNIRSPRARFAHQDNDPSISDVQSGAYGDTRNLLLMSQSHGYGGSPRTFRGGNADFSPSSSKRPVGWHQRTFSGWAAEEGMRLQDDDDEDSEAAKMDRAVSPIEDTEFMIDHSNVSATKAKNTTVPAMWRGSPPMRASAGSHLTSKRTSDSYADMDDESDEETPAFKLNSEDQDWETIGESSRQQFPVEDSHASNFGFSGSDSGNSRRAVLHPADNQYQHGYRVHSSISGEESILLPSYDYASGSFPHRNALSAPKAANAGQMRNLSPINEQASDNLSQSIHMGSHRSTSTFRVADDRTMSMLAAGEPNDEIEYDTYMPSEHTISVPVASSSHEESHQSLAHSSEAVYMYDSNGRKYIPAFPHAPSSMPHRNPPALPRTTLENPNPTPTDFFPPINYGSLRDVPGLKIPRTPTQAAKSISTRKSGASQYGRREPEDLQRRGGSDNVLRSLLGVDLSMKRSSSGSVRVPFKQRPRASTSGQNAMLGFLSPAARSHGTLSDDSHMTHMSDFMHGNSSSNPILRTFPQVIRPVVGNGTPVARPRDSAIPRMIAHPRPDSATYPVLCKRKNRLSWQVFWALAIVPPLLVLYGVGWLDPLMTKISAGEFDSFGTRQKNWALCSGAIFSVMIPAVIVIAIFLGPAMN